MSATPALAAIEQRAGARNPGWPQDPEAEYSDVRRRIQGLVRALISPGSTVIVVSKGDRELVRLDGREGWHFPRGIRGEYAGFHPADGVAAISHLEELQEAGGDCFLLPSTYFWWLEHYTELAAHLRSRCRLLADCPDTCLIYDLHEPPDVEPPAEQRTAIGARGPAEQVEDNGGGSRLLPPIRSLVSSLLPRSEAVLVVSEGNDELLRLGRRAWHFPQDASGAHAPLAPSVGAAAVSQLEGLSAMGVRYLLVPATASRLVDRCEELRDYLAHRCRLVALRESVCTVYELGFGAGEPARREPPRGGAAGSEARPGSVPPAGMGGRRPGRIRRFLRRTPGYEGSRGDA